VKDKKKGFYNMLTAKEGSKVTLIHYLMRLVTSQIGTITKQRCLMHFFPLSSTLMVGPRTPGALCSKTETGETLNSQSTLELFRTCCYSWMHISLWGPTGFITGY